MTETPNEQLFKSVSQDSGTTAEELVKRSTGTYDDKNANLTGAAFKQNNTVSPFRGVK